MFVTRIRRDRGFNFGMQAIALPLLLLSLMALSACGVKAQASPAQQANDLVNAGVRAQAQGRNSEAADNYHKALAADPKNKFAYFDLGVIDQNAGRNAAAELDYRSALQIDPNFAGAMYNLAVLRTPSAPDEAITLYHQLISLQPTNAAAHLNLGFLLFSQGKKAEGRAELQRAIELNPQFKSRVPDSFLAAPAPSPKK